MQSAAGRTFDVIVVGSGGSGGWAAKRLAEAGVNVGLLDAGRALTDADYTEHQPATDLPYRNRAPEVITRTRPVPPADGAAVRGAAVQDARQGQARVDHDARPLRQPDQAPQWAAAVPLLRAVRARVRDALLLQLRVLDRRRRPQDGALHARHQ